MNSQCDDIVKHSHTSPRKQQQFTPNTHTPSTQNSGLRFHRRTQFSLIHFKFNLLSTTTIKSAILKKHTRDRADLSKNNDFIVKHIPSTSSTTVNIVFSLPSVFNLTGFFNYAISSSFRNVLATIIHTSLATILFTIVNTKINFRWRRINQSDTDTYPHPPIFKKEALHYQNYLPLKSVSSIIISAEILKSDFLASSNWYRLTFRSDGPAISSNPRCTNTSTSRQTPSMSPRHSTEEMGMPGITVGELRRDEDYLDYYGLDGRWACCLLFVSLDWWVWRVIGEATGEVLWMKGVAEERLWVETGESYSFWINCRMRRGNLVWIREIFTSEKGLSLSESYFILLY